jgi:hypothetical protein
MEEFVMDEILLTQGKIARVDSWKFDELNRFSWQAIKMGKLWYASTTLKLLSGESYPCTMHWAVLKFKPPKGMVIDHIDGDGLNNQEYNLRLVTARQNNQNRHEKVTSKYPGVSWHKLTNKWIAHISINGKVYHLGSFTSEEEAFEKYKRMVNLTGQNVLIKGGE